MLNYRYYYQFYEGDERMMYENTNEVPLVVQFLFDKDVRQHLETCKQCNSIKEGIIRNSEVDNIGKVDLEDFTLYLLRPKNLDGIKLVIDHTRLEAT